MSYSTRQKVRRQRRTHCRKGEAFRNYKKRMKPKRTFAAFVEAVLSAPPLSPELPKYGFVAKSKEPKEPWWKRLVAWLRSLLS